MGKKIWIDDQNRARVCRRVQRVSNARLDRVHEARRTLEAAGRGELPEDQAVRVAVALVLGRVSYVFDPPS